MRIMTTGVDLARRLNPLRANVRQVSEGVNFDRTMMAVHAVDGVNYLFAATRQPSYEMTLRMQVEDASADREDDMWELQNSVLAARNRSVGMAEAEYSVSGGCMEIKVNENSVIRMPAKLHADGSCGFFFDDMNMLVSNAPSNRDVVAYGVFAERVLRQALAVPSSVCQLNSNRGCVKDQAVHLVLKGERLTVEAMSNKTQAQTLMEKAQTVTFVNDGYDVGESLHLAMSVEAAKVLLEIASRNDGPARWVYSRFGELFVECDPYTMCIKVEELQEDACAPIVMGAHSLTVGSSELRRAVRQAKVAGSKTVLLRCLKSMQMEVSTDDGAVETCMAVRCNAPLGQDNEFCLPVNALLAVLDHTDGLDVRVSYEDHGGYVVVDDMNGGVVGIEVM